MKKSIYIHGLGNRNPITEAEQIIWFLEQGAKTYNRKYHTQYWGSLKDMYKARLLQYEAYELLHFLNDKTTSVQEKRRREAQEKTKAKNKRELKSFAKEWEQKVMKVKLINTINYN